VRSACPGVPVYLYEQTPSYLKTLTQLQRERKYPLDPEQWDGAYRVLKAPYYRLLYDERKAIHKPLTEKQLAAIARRKAATRQKYTCRVCHTFSTGRYDRRDFFDGVCNHCRYMTRRFNEQIEWARSLLDNQTVVLDIQTEPEIQPYSAQEEKPLLTGYVAMDLETGAILQQAEMQRTEDLYSLKYLVCPDFSALTPYPWVLNLDPGALYAVRFELERNNKRGVYLFNPNLQELLATLHLEMALKDGRPTSVYGWKDLPHNQHMTARQVLEGVCILHEVPPQGTTVELMRSLVLHLAALQPIELAVSHEKESLAREGGHGEIQTDRTAPHAWNAHPLSTHTGSSG